MGSAGRGRPRSRSGEVRLLMPGFVRQLGVKGLTALAIAFMLLNTWVDSVLWIVSFLIDGATNVMVGLCAFFAYRLLTTNVRRAVEEARAADAATITRLEQQVQGLGGIPVTEAPKGFRVPFLGGSRAA